MSKLKKINVSEVDGNDNSIFPAGTVWIDSQNSLRVSDGTTENGQALNVFDRNGNLASPSGLTIGTIQAPVPGTQIFQSANAWVALSSQGTEGVTQVGWAENPYGGGNIAGITFNDSVSNATKITVGDTSGLVYIWTFDNAGVLTLPSGETIAGDNNLLMLSGHTDGNTRIDVNGGARTVSIATNSNTSWTFDSTGNLILPDISGTIESTITTVNGALQLRSNTGTEMDYYDSTDLDNHWGYISIDGAGAYIVNRSNVAGSAYTVSWTFDTGGILGLPNDNYLETTDINLAVGSQGNVIIRANAANNETDKVWTFGDDGSLTFSDDTVQTTAWAGGRVVAAPASSTGAVGDRAGDIAFDGDYFYYCTAPYGGYQVTLLGGYSNGPFPTVLKGEYPQPQTGWSFEWDSVTYTLVSNATDPNPGEWFLPVDQNINTGAGGTISLSPPGVDIWKRIQWSGDTW